MQQPALRPVPGLDAVGASGFRNRHLYDLEADPLELENLTGNPEHKEIEAEFEALVADRWDAAELHQRIVDSHRSRDFLYGVLSSGKRTSWDFEPEPDRFTLYRGELDDYYDWFGKTI